MTYSKRVHDNYKKSLKNALPEHIKYWEELIKAYEDMYSIDIRVNNKFKKKSNDKY